MTNIKSRDAVFAAAVWQAPNLLHLLLKWGWLSAFFLICIPAVSGLSSFVVSNWSSGAAKQAEYTRLKLECQRQQTAKYGYFNRSSCHNYANNQVGLYAD